MPVRLAAVHLGQSLSDSTPELHSPGRNLVGSNFHVSAWRRTAQLARGA